MVAVLWAVGGLAFFGGARYLLQVVQAQADHRERMAEIAAVRDQQRAEIEQSRAERAHQSRRDVPSGLVDAPTAVIPAVSAPENTGLRKKIAGGEGRRLPTTL